MSVFGKSQETQALEKLYASAQTLGVNFQVMIDSASSIAGIRTQLVALVAEVNTLSGKVDKLIMATSQISANQTALNAEEVTIASDVTTLQTQVTAAISAYQAQAAAISTLQTQVTALQSQNAASGNPLDLSGLVTSQQAMEAATAQLATAFTPAPAPATPAPATPAAPAAPAPAAPAPASGTASS